MLRLGYSYWGFLGDNKVEDGKHVSTPDGNATYSWSIIHEAHKRGWQVTALQRDRDLEAWGKFGGDNFAAFSREKRTEAYLMMRHAGRSNGKEAFPDLDVLLVEWRFPIPGRNTPDVKGQPGYQIDLQRQTEILMHYKSKGTKIILWDLDHKLTLEDELLYVPDAIFETSAEPLHLCYKRTRVEPPVCTEDLLQYSTLSANPFNKLAYIGSRYERDDIITEYVKPTSDRWPFHVRFHGNWLKTVEDCRKFWPRIDYNDRVTVKDFRKIYGDAVACPLLAKKSYLESGFITPRPWEALMFGTIPIGISQAKGIEDYVLFHASTGEEMADIVGRMVEMPLGERDRIRRENIDKIGFMDVKHFVDKIEEVVNGNVAVNQDMAEQANDAISRGNGSLLRAGFGPGQRT